MAYAGPTAMSRKSKLTYAQKVCVSEVGRMMHQSRMIWPGARMGVAVSGGVDSFVLIRSLMERKAVLPFPFEVMALHINPGFSPQSHVQLASWAAANGIPAHVELTDHGPRAHSDENRKNSPCFFCSMLRRTRLFELCRHYRLTHLAFGHNADDLVVTTFMNLMQNGRVDGLAAREPFFGGRLMVVRPALLVEKRYMKTAARQWALPVWVNDCPSAGRTRRDEIADRVAGLWKDDKTTRTNIFNALRKFQLDLTSTFPSRIRVGNDQDTCQRSV